MKLKPIQGKKATGTRTIFTTIVLAGTATLLSACAGNAGVASPSATDTSISSATASPSSVPQRDYAPSSGEVIKTKYGSYLKSTILDSDPAMKVDPKTIDASITPALRKELGAAQRAIITFIAEEGIDSTLNGAIQTPDQWWKEHKGKIHPDYQKAFYKEVSTHQPFVVNEHWQQKTYKGKYHYVYKDGSTRIFDRVIKPSKIWAISGDAIALKADVSYKMESVPGVGKTKTGLQSSSGTMTYSVSKDPATGKWLIDGFQHKVATTEG